MKNYTTTTLTKEDWELIVELIKREQKELHAEV